MKFKITVLTVLLSINFVYGQEEKRKPNAVKLNVAGLFIGSIGVQYEYQFSRNFSFNNSFYYRGKSQVPFARLLDNYAKTNGLGLSGIDFTYIHVDKAKAGYLGYSPELRYYVGKEKNPTYFGLYGEFDKIDMNVPADLQVLKSGRIFEVTAPVDFDIRTNTIGLLVGKQVNFKNVHIDFMILGFSLGKASKVEANIQSDQLSSLTDAEKQYLKNKAIDRFNLNTDYFVLDVDSEQVEFYNIRKIPFFSIRTLGVNLGYRF